MKGLEQHRWTSLEYIFHIYFLNTFWCCSGQFSSSDLVAFFSDYVYSYIISYNHWGYKCLVYTAILQKYMYGMWLLSYNHWGYICLVYTAILQKYMYGMWLPYTLASQAPQVHWLWGSLKTQASVLQSKASTTPALELSQTKKNCGQYHHRARSLHSYITSWTIKTADLLSGSETFLRKLTNCINYPEEIKIIIHLLIFF